MQQTVLFKKSTFLFYFILVCSFLSSCTSSSSSDQIKEPVKAIEEAKQTEKQTEKIKQLPQKTKYETDCNSVSSVFGEANKALWLKEHGIAITKFTKICNYEGDKTGDQKGFIKDSSIIAMGFPCSFESGKISISGNQWSPKMISFVLSTSCPLKEPKDAELNKLRNTLGLSDSSKILAVNPFALQYWEAKDLTDADVGFSIDLRSVLARQHVWRKFTENGEAIGIKLFGRENSWGSNNHMYEAEADIVYQPQMKFRLNIKSVKLMSQEEIDAAHLRCKKLVPRRRCESVF